MDHKVAGPGNQWVDLKAAALGSRVVEHKAARLGNDMASFNMSMDIFRRNRGVAMTKTWPTQWPQKRFRQIYGHPKRFQKFHDIFQ